MDVARWVFHAGWPGLGAPDGVLMVRTDAYASMEWGLGLFTVSAPGSSGFLLQTGAS
jgi:hypothetical protein